MKCFGLTAFHLNPLNGCLPKMKTSYKKSDFRKVNDTGSSVCYQLQLGQAFSAFFCWHRIRLDDTQRSPQDVAVPTGDLYSPTMPTGQGLNRAIKETGCGKGIRYTRIYRHIHAKWLNSTVGVDAEVVQHGI